MNHKLIPGFLRKLSIFLLPLFVFTNVVIAQNPIVTENALPGTDQGTWDSNDGTDIQGFATNFSVNKGDSVKFKININSPVLLPYTIDIYRLGYYNNNGARFIDNLGPSLTGMEQPAYLYENSTGKVDCSNWSESARWKVPDDAVSGVYIARLECATLNSSSLIIFVVRDDTSSSKLLFKTSDATWQAYNYWGGNTFYAANTPVPGFTHATKLSYQRPLTLRGDKSNFFSDEFPMIRWLERNGYDVTYTSDIDMARDASVITPSKHKVLLSVGHDEYWSAEQFNKFETARNNGVNIAFFSGNTLHWKTRWEDNFQTLVCYKEGTQGIYSCGSKCDPVTNVWTGLWRDGCLPAYGTHDGCRPEGPFLAQMGWTESTGSIKVPDTYKNLRFWKNTSIAALGSGQTATLPLGTLGAEWDQEQFVELLPARRIPLSFTTFTGLNHRMYLYRHDNSGALVFSAGTMQWCWGLDDNHDNPSLPPSLAMQQATVNLLFDMGATAETLQQFVVAPSASTDVLPPSTTIVNPIHTSTVPGSPITISGTAADNGGGAVGGVEVSTDNGATWHRASGLESWTYTFSPTGYGTIVVKARAWDDMFNLETPGSNGTPNNISITLVGPFTYSVFNSTYPTAEPSFFNVGAPGLELGMKFRSTIPGFITGFRYYKGASVDGSHVGNLWSSTGTLLASEPFVNETASGWQTTTLAVPVAITANTTYIVSYFAANGKFSYDDPFFTSSITNGPLRGLANGEQGANGVSNYPGSAFPSGASGSSNYYADVVFTSSDITPPQVVSVNPANNTNGGSINVNPSATFDEAIDPGTVTTSTVILTGPGNVVIPGTVSVSGLVVTIYTPTNPLLPNTTYTVTLKGGFVEPVIKDLSGNALAGDYVWTFTTESGQSPNITTQPVSQTTCANSSISFTSAANGVPNPAVKWQVSTNNGASWSDISGETNPTYTFNAVLADNNNQYRAVWTNTFGVVESNPATLTIATSITGTITPVNATVCEGEPLQLLLSAATGPGPYTLIINSDTYSGINLNQPFTPYGSAENIFSPADLPLTLLQPDNSSIEVGVKFRTDKPGVIKGIRFYKGGVANGGSHKGSLWSQSGTLLATATFTGETNSGWQEVLFSSPVAINSNTTYVASYFAPQGNYSKSENFFTNSPFTNGNSLTALQHTVSEPNGVYKYAGSSIFPNDNSGEPNYWVDVVFEPIATTTTTFNLTSITASNGCNATGSPLSTTTITVLPGGISGVITGTSPLCIGVNATFTTNGSPGGTWSSTNTAVATVNPATGVVTTVGAGSTDITYSVTGCFGSPSTAFKTLIVNPTANAGIVSGQAGLCVGSTSLYVSNGDPGGIWSSTNAPVASINGVGQVTAVSPGFADFVYTVTTGCYSPVFSYLTIEVKTSINTPTVSGASPLCVGQTATYTKTGESGGVWSSSNTGVATVNPVTGLVTAVASGTTDITYTIVGCSGNLSAFQTLTVIQGGSAGLISGTSPLCIGATSSYSSDGNPGGTWSSTNPLVASVNPTTGLVSALAQGNTDITYTVTACSGTLAAFKTLTVDANANPGTITGISPLCIGATTTYSSNGTPGGVWNSGNPAVVTINASTGEVTAVSAGTTTITYTVPGCNGTATINVTVNPNANAGTVTGSAPLCIGITAIFTSDGDAGGTWSSSNTSVAIVNPSTGEVTALAGGTTNITYTVNSGCNNPVAAFSTLTVTPNGNAGTVSGQGRLCVGSTAFYTSNGDAGGVWSTTSPLVATINSVTGEATAVSEGFVDFIYTKNTGCNGPSAAYLTIAVQTSISAGVVSGSTPLCIGATATYSSDGVPGGVWSSSNTAVGTVNSSTGLVTALSAGTTNIVYTLIGCANDPVSASASLTVNPNVNGGTISGTSPLCIGATSVYSSNGDAGGTWSSTNPLVASVNPTTGLVTALAQGSTDITYTVTACNGTASVFKTLTVDANANPGTITGASPLCIGATATYTSNGDAGGVWNSGNPAVVTVNSSTGQVTAVSAGTTTITYTVPGCNGTATTNVTVNPNANAGTVTGSSPLCIGITAIFTSDGDAGGTWSSTNSTVASVNPATGEVTALAGGTTNITYTVNSGCNNPVAAFSTLTVTPNGNAGTVSGQGRLCVGSTAFYTSNGDAGGVWSTTSPLVATINSVTGEATAISEGFTDFIYTKNTGCNGPSAAFLTIAVQTSISAGVVSGSTPLCIGATATYSSDGVVGGVWSSTNAAVATVTPATGLVTAIGAGTCNISYTLIGCGNNPVVAIRTLTVNPDVNAGTVSGISPLCVGAITTYTSNGNAGGSWTSTNPTVASVNSLTGEVTALANGTTNITYTVNGCNGPAEAFKTQTVSGIANAGTVSGTSSVCIGDPVTYTSNGNAGGTWSSTNTAVATVNTLTGQITTLSAGTTDITYTVAGCTGSASAFKTLTVTSCGSTIVNLKLFLQGYYIGGGQMQPVLLNQGVGVSATETDTITVELHDANAPNATVATAKGILNTDGTASLIFAPISGSYYIAIKHRNTVQTWSANPVAVGAVPVLYEFSTAANKAFGNNMKQEGSVWLLYTGDQNQDEFIDPFDFGDFDTDSQNGVNGVYVATDFNGDGFVDPFDFQVFDENSQGGISSIHP